MAAKVARSYSTMPTFRWATQRRCGIDAARTAPTSSGTRGPALVASGVQREKATRISATMVGETVERGRRGDSSEGGRLGRAFQPERNVPHECSRDRLSSMGSSEERGAGCGIIIRVFGAIAPELEQPRVSTVTPGARVNGGYGMPEHVSREPAIDPIPLRGDSPPGVDTDAETWESRSQERRASTRKRGPH